MLGEGSRATRNFFRVVTDWHRWLGAKGDNRNVARAITGASNLGFLFLVVSGFYLWWPQQLSRKFLRNVTWFKRGLPAKARDFNWHNVIGFWSAVPLFIVVLSAVVISYTWAGNLVYRLAGETPPTPRANQPPPNSRQENKPTAESLAGLDTAWSQAERQLSDWQSISLQLPSSATAPLVFNIDTGNGGQPQARGQLTIDRAKPDSSSLGTFFELQSRPSATHDFAFLTYGRSRRRSWANGSWVGFTWRRVSCLDGSGARLPPFARLVGANAQSSSGRLLIPNAATEPGSD